MHQLLDFSKQIYVYFHPGPFANLGTSLLRRILSVTSYTGCQECHIVITMLSLATCCFCTSCPSITGTWVLVKHNYMLSPTFTRQHQQNTRHLQAIWGGKSWSGSRSVGLGGSPGRLTQVQKVKMISRVTLRHDFIFHRVGIDVGAAATGKWVALLQSEESRTRVRWCSLPSPTRALRLLVTQDPP